MGLGLQLFKSLTGPAGSISKGAYYMAIKLVLAVGGRLQFLSKGLLEYHYSIELAHPCMSNPRNMNKKCNIFYDLALAVAHHHFYHILLVTRATLC